MILPPPRSRVTTKPATAPTGSPPAPDLIDWRLRMTCSLAPPCSGPLSVPIAATIAECMSDRVAAQTRAANVEAFIVWSACRTRQVSRISAARSLGAVPVIWSRKLAAIPASGSGAGVSRPWRAAS